VDCAAYDVQAQLTTGLNRCGCADFFQLAHNRGMAQGWESKSVEEQKSADSGSKPHAISDKPGADKAQAAHDAHRKRKIQELTLQRERILSERTASPHRREALKAALVEIEMKLAELGWAIHL
jgi:hypothetical protein